MKKTTSQYIMKLLPFEKILFIRIHVRVDTVRIDRYLFTFALVITFGISGYFNFQLNILELRFDSCLKFAAICKTKLNTIRK